MKWRLDIDFPHLALNFSFTLFYPTVPDITRVVFMIPKQANSRFVVMLVLTVYFCHYPCVINTHVGLQSIKSLIKSLANQHIKNT